MSASEPKKFKLETEEEENVENDNSLDQEPMSQIEQNTEELEAVIQDFQNKTSDMEYKILTAESIFATITNIVNHTAEVIPLPPSKLMTLLNYMKWDEHRLLEKYFDDESKLLKNANVIIPTQTDGPDFIQNPFFCEICLNDTILSEQTSAMSCGHRFCNTCWTTYLHGQVMDEGTSQTITCPAQGCPIFVEYEMVTQHITEEPIIRKYQQLIARNFVDSSRRLRWCPGTGCNNAVSVEAAKWSPVTCPCGSTFCFLCGHDWHEPVKCDMLFRWLKKCKDDSETANWMQANTKDCPKCKTMIEKNGGCNHMSCRTKSCLHEFCWICMQDWKTHTGDAYNCNRFIETTNESSGQARVSLTRYLHYYERYMSHMRSLTFETKLNDTVNKKMATFQSEFEMSWVDVQFFDTAIQTLCNCRKTLMYTYSFAFFLAKSNQSELFEDNQRDLESATEELSGYLENDLMKDTDGNHIEFDPNELKKKILNSSAYCASRRLILTSHVLEGYEEKTWTYRDGLISQS